MSEVTNGHSNGFGSDDDVSDLSSEEGEEEECEERLNGGVGQSGANGQSMNDGDEDSDPSNVPTREGDELDDDDDEDSDSDSAPEDISFKTGRNDFQQKSNLQQKQIEKCLTAAKDKRRRRDDLMKEQKAAKLAKLKEAKLSADFLQSLDSSSKPSPVDSLLPSDSADSDLKFVAADSDSLSKSRKVFSLPDVEGTEFEVVVEKSDADQEIMKKVNRYIKKHVNPKSLPRQTAKKKQSLASKRRMLKRTR